MKALRAYFLRRWLTPAQLAVVTALDRPDRWQPDAPITPDEARNWEATLSSPLGIKIDHAMINWMQQEAQRALFAPTAEIARTVGFAAGCRAGWQMAKTLSRIAAPNDGTPETTSPTADAGLEQHQP